MFVFCSVPNLFVGGCQNVRDSKWIVCVHVCGEGSIGGGKPVLAKHLVVFEWKPAVE